MTRACHIAVRSATGDVFSDAEIDDLLDRLGEKARRARKDAPTASEKEAVATAAQALTREALFGALIDRRLKLAAQLARDGRRLKLDAMPAALNGAERLEALNVGSNKQGFGLSNSVDAQGRALQMQLWGQVKRGLAALPGLSDRMSNPFGVAEGGFDRLLAREMARLNGAPGIEPTGDEGALHAARVLVKALDDGRLMQNDQGAWIDQLPGYIARQSHDADKIGGGFWRELGELGRRAQASGLKDVDWAAARRDASARAFGEWRDFIRPKLDPKTFEGLELEDIPFAQWEDEAQEQRQLSRAEAVKAAQALHGQGIIADPNDVAELMLHRVWMDIVTGRHAAITGMDDLGDFRPPASMARTVSKARVLHFNSPDDWMDYAAKYSHGNLFSTVMGQLERAARNSALMKAWGPAPDAAFAAEVERLAGEAQARGDVAGVKSLQGSMVRARFEAINGMADAPDNMRLAQVMRTLRGWESLTKLGGIVLSSVPDLPITGHVFARAGGGFLRGYRAWFAGVARLESAEAKQAAEALDVGARAFAGHIGAQYLAGDGAPGWTSWATQLMFRISGFEFYNNGVRQGAAAGYARLLGMQAERGWADLNSGFRETFERFGIGAADWEAVRHGLTPAADGKTYFTLDHLEQGRAGADLRLKFATMLHDIFDDAVSEPRARERSGFIRGTKAGTLQGEFWRSFFQFKGFAASIWGRHLVPAARGYAGYSPVALLTHMILATVLAGYVSMSAKMIARGEAPRDPFDTDPHQAWRTWGAALAQGGGLGLYGDFLFGNANRMGAQFALAQLGGPILSDAEMIGNVVQQAVSGGQFNETTGRSPIPAELTRLGASNIPLINVWYTRLALDYLVLWRLQEAASPGYLQRYHDRVVNQQHSSFWLDPTTAQ